ncbi:MAG: tetratricopeptide repeat protein [bacterium]|nr:tetratricopeptide repeat protein [bacterium]
MKLLMNRFVGIISIVFLVNFVRAETALDHYKKGEELQRAKKYPQAIYEYKKAIKQNPYYKEAYNRLGEVYYALLLFSEAISCFNKSLEIDKDFLAPYVNLGKTYEKKGDLDKAKGIFKKAEEINPVSFSVHYNLARVLYKTGDVTGAIDRYKKALKLRPNHTLTYLNIGSIYKKEGKGDLALKYYKKALECDPKNEWVYISLGSLYEEENYKNAIEEYKKALKINPKNIAALNRLGNIYLKDNSEKAISIYEKVQRLEQSSLSYYNLGFVYEHFGEYDKARDVYKKALELDPYDELSLYHLEKVLIQLEDATSLLRGKYSTFHYDLGNYYLERGNYPLSIYEYKRAIKLNPQDSLVRFSLSKIYFLQKRYPQSIVGLRHVIELNPHHLEAKDLLEKAYYIQEGLLSTKEGIDLENLPRTSVKIVVNFTSKRFLHIGIEDYIKELLVSLLDEFPQVDIVERKTVSLKDIAKIKDLTEARYVMFGSIKEREKDISIKVDLIDTTNLKKVIELDLKRDGKDRMKELVSILKERLIEEIKPEGVIVKVLDGEVIINLGTSHRVAPGQIFEILGRREDVIGKIEIKEVESQISLAKILDPTLIRYVKVNQTVRPVKGKKPKEERD